MLSFEAKWIEATQSKLNAIRMLVFTVVDYDVCACVVLSIWMGEEALWFACFYVFKLCCAATQSIYLIHSATLRLACMSCKYTYTIFPFSYGQSPPILYRRQQKFKPIVAHPTNPQCGMCICRWKYPDAVCCYYGLEHEWCWCMCVYSFILVHSYNIESRTIDIRIQEIPQRLCMRINAWRALC